MADGEADKESLQTPRPGPAGLVSPSAGPEEMVRAAIVGTSQAVRRYLFGMCGDWHEAQDLAQEALLKAWEKRGSFAGRAGAKTWIFAIARNAWLDRLRRARAGPTRQSMNDELTSGVDPPSLAMSRAELASAVRQACARLPVEQREAVALRESEGLSFSEIGQLLGVPPATVKSRVRYALLKLAEELEPYRRELES